MSLFFLFSFSQSPILEQPGGCTQSAITSQHDRWAGRGEQTKTERRTVEIISSEMNIAPVIKQSSIDGRSF